MKFITTDEWNEGLWQKVRDIYLDAFANHGGKPEKVLRNMFTKCNCHLHVAFDRELPVGMAITGEIDGSSIVIIDYLAIKQNRRGQGIGQDFFHYIQTWAHQQVYCKYLLLEVESDQTKDSTKRIQFWEKCGFTMLREYTHQYIWVPEPYQAMYLSLFNHSEPPFRGEEAFKYITAFHRKSFRGIN
jgi:GNAT superfamily N-acetyltransferase